MVLIANLPPAISVSEIDPVPEPPTIVKPPIDAILPFKLVPLKLSGRSFKVIPPKEDPSSKEVNSISRSGRNPVAVASIRSSITVTIAPAAVILTGYTSDKPIIASRARFVSAFKMTIG